MNSYLSREEKQNFVRATALVTLIEETIDGYASAKSTDPEFLKYLRTGRTMIQKALKMRADALDPDAKQEFNKQAGRLEFICVPTAEAKKAHAELVALRTTLPMEVQDFEDWYENVIEATCKMCLRTDYQECKARRVLAKYGVYPIDPGANGKCQYSYVGTPEQEELQPADTETVPVNKYNLAVSQIRSAEERTRELNSTIESHEDVIKDLNFSIDIWHKQYVELESKQVESEEKIKVAEQKCDFLDDQLSKSEEEKNKALAQVTVLQSQLEAAVAAQEQPKEEYPVSIGLASGGEFEYLLPARMAEIMIEEIQQPRHSRSTCAQYISGRMIAIDLQEVVALHVDKLPHGDWVKPKVVQDLPRQYEQGKYRIECKCGAKYFVELATGKTKAWCRECKTPVFADHKADVKTADGSAATLLTNRYWVEREQETENPRNVQPALVPRKFQSPGAGYVDPVNPFAD